jgi:DNA polymerase-3 subunit delta
VPLTPEQLEAGLSRRLAPAYLIAGDEPLLLQEAADVVRRAARDAGFGEREVHVAERGFDWAAFEDAVSSMSLFAERRLIELRLPTPKAAEPGAEVLQRVLASPPEDVLLLAVAPRLEKRTLSSGWVGAFDRAGCVVHARPVDVRQLPDWVAGRMRRAGLAPDADAVRLLVERCEGNLLAAHQEIEKLRLLHGEGEVDAEAVRDAVSDSARYDVFKLADAAVAGDLGRALRVLSGLRAEGMEPPIVLWALTREVRTAEQVRWLMDHGTSRQAAMGKARVWSSRAGLVARAVSRHDGASLRALTRLAARADRFAKGSERGDPWQALTDLVVGFAGSPGRRAA